MIDFMLTSLEADEYRLHTAVAEALGRGEGEGKFPLYRRVGPLVAVRLEDCPAHLSAIGREPTIPADGEVVSFTLAAHCARSGGGKRYPCADDAARIKWLEDQAKRSGFELTEITSITTEAVPVERKGRKWAFPRTTFDGRLRVADRDTLTAAMARGVGSSMRSFGCGLLTLH